VKYRARIYLRELLHVLCPAEVFLVLVLLMSGILALIHYDRPDPISLLLPQWVSIGWDVVLVAGGLVTLGGLIMLNWIVVRLGYTLLVPAATAYAVALIPHATVLSIRINVAILLAFAASGLWRSLQITFTIRRSG
jgi:hypothetical protein